MQESMADEALIHRLQTQHPERFSVLCRMHLSFLLDLTSEELNEIYKGRIAPDHRSSARRAFLAPLQRKNKGTIEAWDGTCVDSLVKCSEALEVLIRFLGRAQNIREEGLFRKSGKKSRQQELRKLMDAGEGDRALETEEHGYSVHDCASLLKGYLADLPEPLLSEAHYKAHCQIAGLCKPTFNEQQRASARQRQIQSLQLLFLLLPRENRRLLRHLLALLHRVSLECCGNLMDASNLATMFAPHILCPRKMTAEDLVDNSRNMTRAIAFMVDNAEELFHVPVALLQDVRTALGQHQRLEDGSGGHRARCCSEAQDGGEVVGGDSDPDAVETVITFCERRPPAGADTAKSDGGSSSEVACNHTEVALAELYAYVQAMPESLKKKQLIKQFNRETGPGVSPMCSANPKKHQRSKSLRKCIKKHLFGGTSGHQRHRSNSDQNVLPVSQDILDGGRPPAYPPTYEHHHYHHHPPPPHPTIRHPAFCPARARDKSVGRPASSEVAVTAVRPVKPSWNVPHCLSHSAHCLLLFCHRDTLHLNRTGSDDVDSDLYSSDDGGEGDPDVRLLGIRALAVSFCDGNGPARSNDDSLLSVCSVRSMTSFQSLYRLPKCEDSSFIVKETSV